MPSLKEGGSTNFISMSEIDTYAHCCDHVLEDLRLHGTVSFTINTSPYYLNCSERCVEIPWAISNFKGEGRILDVGVSLADQVYFWALLSLFDLGAKEIHGIDIIPLERTLERFTDLSPELVNRVIFRKADVRSTGYSDNYFDMVFLISTVEHVGFDQEIDAKDTVFNRPLERPSTVPDLRQHRGDLEAIGELGRIVKSGGTLLVSVPFGVGGIVTVKDSKGRYASFVQYDYARWQLLLASSGLRLIEERFFGHFPESGWQEADDPNLVGNMRFLQKQGMAQAVACARLIR